MTERAPKMKIRQGDRVVVLSGKDRGKPPATVTRVIPERGLVIVEGINLSKRHQRPTKSTMQGGIIDKDMPIAASNVAVVCPACGQPTRIGYRVEGGEKHRICKKCNKDL